MNLFWKRIPQTAQLEQKMAKNHELYHSFVKTEKSAMLAEYKELADIDFKQARKEFKSKEEYSASPMFEKEKRYMQLLQDSDIKNYLRFEKTDAFIFHENFTQSSFEEFSGNKIDREKWVNAFRWSFDQIKGAYVNEGEFQAYTEGENTDVINGQLHITTKRKDAQGRVWNKEKGFIMKPFNYTSDVISSDVFSSDKGCIIVKFKLEGANKSLRHFVRVCDSKNQRCISLLESDGKRKFKVGHSLRKRNESSYAKISGLNLEKDFHLLVFEWNKEVMTWRINDCMLCQQTNVGAMNDMHLALGSYIVDEKGAEGRIIVDYIRRFEERKA